ncbi:hypothetical protein AX17_006545 [Amanita inopinata Kibby_2008]|nr:hypothetical protein AX17_006545 [Amanita inopinata Kibby_2008]
MSSGLSKEDIVQVVTDNYSSKAKQTVSPGYARTVAEALGYTKEQLEGIPDGANMGLSCGNPVATASLKEGEHVLDLGSGGGIDVFLAASKVGPTGQVVGLDNSMDMVELARQNAAKQNFKSPNVSFVQASLTENLPITSDSVDCILSNCVINLLPLAGKAGLMKEAHRVLRPGGRMTLDDIVAKNPLPDNILNDLKAYVNCISGAITLDEYKQLFADAGFQGVSFVATNRDLNVYYEGNANKGRSCCRATATGQVPTKPDYDANEYVASYQIRALKSGDVSTDTKPLPDVLLRHWDAFPTVKASPPPLTAEEVLSLIRDPSSSSTDYAVVDVRRNDHAGGHVRGSHQCPAQTFHNDLPQFFDKFKNTEKVIFYCGSSNGRGPRCAGWYQDYLDTVGQERASKAYVLEGGIRGWLSKYKGQDDLVDYD